MIIDCQRCSGTNHSREIKISGFHSILCLDCINEWAELYYSEPYREERLKLDILIDAIESDLRLNIKVEYDSLVKVNTRLDQLNKIAFDMAKAFVAGKL